MQCNEKKKIQRYDNWPVSRPSSGEVLIEVKAAGLCQSDLHILYAQEKHVPDEFIMGHEIAGQIIEVGKSGVPAEYKVGLRVALSISLACGTCPNCRNGSDNNCLGSGIAYGLSTDGGFQQFLVVKNLRGLIPIPDGVTYEQAAVTSDAVLTPFHAIRRAKEDLLPGSKVLVVGTGGLGVNALQILRNYGCYIVAVDLKSEMEELARKYGASEFYVDINQSKHEIESFDVCFDFCGFQESFDMCQKYVKQRGRIMPVGLGRSKLFFKNYELARREIKVIFSFGGTSHEQAECMNWVAQGRIKPLSTAVKMSALPEYMDKLAKGRVKGRIVFEPSKL